VVTLGNLTSKIIRSRAEPEQPVSDLMFTQFTTVALNASLGSVMSIFKRDAFCLVVASQRAYTKERTVCEKKVVAGVVSQVCPRDRALLLISARFTYGGGHFQWGRRATLPAALTQLMPRPDLTRVRSTCCAT
jgi:hypothetical protein